MFEPRKEITLEEQIKWKEAGIRADQTSYEMVNYQGATSLTLLEGQGVLRNSELNGTTLFFVKFNIRLNNAHLKESQKQLFREVYFVPSSEDLQNVKKFTIKKGLNKTVQVDGIPIFPKNLSRRFPSLIQQVHNHVWYVPKEQTIVLKTIPVAAVIAYTIEGKSFYKIVKDYAIEN